MSETPQKEKLNVLFVDDEVNVLRSLSRLFADEEYGVITAESGTEGLEILKRTEVGVVVSDQSMPRMKGVEFLERVKETWPDTVRIVLTGQADLTATIDFINRGGAYQYIAKPWDDDNLIAAVRRAAEKYRLVKDNRSLTELTRKQNDELARWNRELEIYVQEQTVDLTEKNKELVRAGDRLKKNFRDFIVTISSLIELRNTNIINHSNNVAAVAREMARQMGLAYEDVEDIAIAAQLHDVGRIAEADAILLKQANELTPDEMSEYRKHPVRGQAAIHSNEPLARAGTFIRSHHEWFDGSGFPDGLKGDGIPLGGRIVSIADKYDRMLQDRTAGLALEELSKLRGVQFDPSLYHPLEDAVMVLESARSQNRGVEKKLATGELAPGMIVSREVRSGTGILLFSEGAVLNAYRINLLLRHFTLDPPASRAVYIRMPENQPA